MSPKKKNQMNILVSDNTREKINRLCDFTGDTITGVVTIAIDRMYREELSQIVTDPKDRIILDVD